MPEQVQDFYPTLGTISTVMYYTGINPMNGKQVYVTTDYHEKQLQRALLQYSKPENANLVREALRLAGREDLIGNTPECLVRPSFKGGRFVPEKKDSKGMGHKNGAKTQGRNKHSAPVVQKKTSSRKFDRIFGEDADRIRREAEAMSKGRTKPKKTAKPTQKRGKK
jgi:hypothetical protein